MTTREIIRAEHAGFCFGVKQAIEKAEQAVEEHEEIFSCGSLIHNKDVTDELERKGLKTVNSAEELPKGSNVVVRSHGETKAFFDIAKRKNINVINATCPYVTKIHEIVASIDKQEYEIVVVGDKNHPEVKGINGWCNNSATIINSEEEAEEISGKNICVVAQTTIMPQFFDVIIKTLCANNNVKIENTICAATIERQKSCEEVAKQCDIMLIIGSKESSNTRKLFDISKKYCQNTHFVETVKKLPLQKIKTCCKIGVTAGASTPERAIEEVIANMSEFITNENETNLMEDLMEEIEKSLRLPRGGEVVRGTVLQVTDREVVVNLGCKKDGIIPKDEVVLEEGQTLKTAFSEGEEIQAKVLKTDDGDGNILLSRRKLEVTGHWDEINVAFEERATIDVKVTKLVKGGVIASYKEVSGYIPLSQLSDRFIENADAEEYIGRTLPVRVTRVDQKRNKVVFSHRSILAEERQKKIEDVWNALSVDDIVEGTVMRFTEYGAFVDVGGLDGLLHISEISWGKLKHPKEVLEIGQKINVKVLAMNPERSKISLGLKQTSPEPWMVIDEKFSDGQVVTGKVVQIKDYGAFIELAPGLDGLVHISEIAHTRVTNIANELSIGQEVTAKILEINKEKKRISLSIKETLDPPIFDESKASGTAEVAAESEETPAAASEEVEVVEAVAEEVEAVTEEVEAVTEEVEAVTEEVEAVTEEVEAVTEEVEAVTEEVEEAAEEVEAVTEEVEEAAEEVEAVTEEVEEAAEEVEAVTEEVEEAAEEIEAVTEEVEEAAEEAEAVTEEVEEAAEEIEKEKAVEEAADSEEQ